MAVALFAILLTAAAGALAAPADRPAIGPAHHQSPDWLSADTASRLAVGFDVLVPPYVPAPFGGEPAVIASDGFYSLYWLVPGAPPTYLRITGELGGVIPDFSYYDRNVQLSVNASVGGSPAYHDLTPIYDLVYWQVGSVVYTVESRNLAGDDSLSLANRLVVLPPSEGGGTGGDEPTGGGAEEAAPGEPAIEAALGVPEVVRSGETASIGFKGPDGAVLSVDGGTFPGVGGPAVIVGPSGAVDWQAPATEVDLTVTFVLADPDNGDWLASAQAVVVGVAPPAEGTNFWLSCPATTGSGELATVALGGEGGFSVDATDGGWPAQPPNTHVAPSADGGTRLAGTVVGPVDLQWLAPVVAETTPTYVFLANGGGSRVAECRIDVVPLAVAIEDDGAPAEPTAKPRSSRSSRGSDGTSIEDNPTAVRDLVDADALAEPGDRTDITGAVTPTPTPKSTAGPTKTPAPNDGGADDEADDAETPRAKPTGTPGPTRTPTPKPPKPTPSPTSTLAPTSGQDGMVALVIGPEGGKLTSPSGAIVVIPEGALAESSTVTIKPVPDTKLPVSPEIDFVPGSGFDVTIATADGLPVEELARPATLRIKLPDNPRPGTTMYRLDGARVVEVEGARMGDETVSAAVDQFSRFALGVPTPTAEDDGSITPLMVGAVLGGFALLAAAGLFAATRRRARYVTPRRQGLPRGRLR